MPKLEQIIKKTLEKPGLLATASNILFGKTHKLIYNDKYHYQYCEYL